MENLGELRRSTSDGKVAGVCVMLADRWQVDPLLVRVAALLLALSSGIGLVVYAAAWALVPPQGSDRAPIDSVFPSVRRLGLKAGIALLAVVCVAAAAMVGHLAPFGVGPALVMGAVWYFGWYRPEQQRRVDQPKPAAPHQLAARPFAETTPFTEAAAVWQQRVQEYLQAQAGPAHPAPPTTVDDPGYSLQAYLAHPDPVGLYDPDPPAPQPQPRAEKPAAQPIEAPADDPAAGDGESSSDGEAVPVTTRRRRRTGRMHVIGWALTLIAIGTIAVLDQSLDLPLFAYPAALLAAIGVTLIIGAWLPRPRGLVVVGALLAVVIGIGATPMPDLPRSAVTYSSIAELPADVQTHDTGQHTADLSALRLDRDVTYATRVDVGQLTIVVPANTNVRVVWTVDVGDATVLDLHRASGVDLSDTTMSHGADPDGPTLTIEARVGLGQLEVTR